MRLRLGVVPLLVVALLLPSNVASADLEDDLKAVEDGIAAINQQIQAQGAARSGLQIQLATAQLRLQEVRLELEAAEGRVAAGLVAIEQAGNEATRLVEALEQGSLELAETRLTIAQTGNELTDRAVDSYMNHAAEVPAGFLNVASVTDVLIGAEYASQAIRATEVAIGDLEALKAQETVQQAQIEKQKERQSQVVQDLNRKQSDLELAQQAVEDRKSEVEQEVAEHAALLASVLALIDELDNEVSKLEADASSIEDEIKAAEEHNHPPGSGFLWPVNGTLTSPFGFRIHPITGQRKLHTGIDIGAPNGRTIVAARSGTVILARYYGGYGNAVVISHGDGLTTLYAHMSSDVVSSGQVLKAGQTVGYVGSTGSSTGNHLHFETREYGIPVDPMNYLGG